MKGVKLNSYSETWTSLIADFDKFTVQTLNVKHIEHSAAEEWMFLKKNVCV